MNEVKVDDPTVQALFENPSESLIAETVLEKELATITPEEASATTVAEAKFQFRELLPKDQLDLLKQNAPAHAYKMVDDYNVILNFGTNVLDSLNQVSTEMIKAQEEIDLPDAEFIVNDLLREMGGFKKKYRNINMEDFFTKLKGFFSGTKNSFQMMVKESKPISQKIEMAEASLRNMELELAENITRGQQLHQIIQDSLQKVVTVLAALEEIGDVVRNDVKELEQLVESNPASQLGKVTWKGQSYSNSEINELFEKYVAGLNEIEKSWMDWRHQFFIGYSQAPVIRNLALVSATMQRRCQSFRTMGIPSARTSLVMWQQSALTKEGATLGNAVKDGTNQLIQDAFKTSAETIAQVSKQAQAPIINEETIWVILDSIESQCNSLVEAEKWGRDERNRNLTALQTAEKGIGDTVVESRKELVKQAVETAKQGINPLESKKADSKDPIAELNG